MAKDDSLASPIISLTNVSKTYRSGKVEVPALKEVNLHIRRGRLTALVGPSGSGKTTLLNILGCIDTPSSGRVDIAGVDAGSLRDRAATEFRAKHIGYVFQNFNLVPVLTAYENVEYALILQKAPARERRKRVLDMLDAVGIGELRDRRPSQLSGGQRQRVAIARALVKNPSIILADEPTANLDSKTGWAIFELMRDMQARYDTTLLVCTHDASLMAAAKDVVTIKDGEVTHQDGDAA